MKNRRAFTLIELLVVVAIIALLIALMLPSLARAKEEAKTVRCGANLHAIGLAMATYTAQNNDIMPQCESPVISSYNVTFMNAWAEQLYIDGCFRQTIRDDGKGALYGHYAAQGYGVLRCPSAEFSGDINDNIARQDLGYGLAWCVTSSWSGANNTINGRPTPWNVYVRNLNSNHIMAADGRYLFGNAGCHSHALPAYPGWNTYSTSTGNYVKLRHSRGATGNDAKGYRVDGGANYLFADGHVEWSANYGWAPSVGTYVADNWSSFSGSNYKGSVGLAANGKPESLKTNPVWLHGPSDR